MKATRKFYVVWEGRAPGIYDSWEECREQVEGYPEAKYKAFTSQDDATEAFRGDPREHLNFARELARKMKDRQKPDYTTIPGIRLDAIAVDGACSRNPGPMEYRGVRVADGAEIFHGGPYEGGTNNIGEYLALIHVAALLARQGDTSTPIYTDSKTALSWLRRGHSNTKLQPTEANAPLRAVLERADAWMASHSIPNPILKWYTEKWGEIPADFGRK
ncbi:MAG: ribonuclease H family protein [Muribaculaceae bacterium]|nr:ribonuclease H family protein [Muribaculaceae bacterium]